MKRAALAAAAGLLAGIGSSPVSAATVSPLSKVTELLQNMLAKGKQEKHAEQVQFAAYKQFCDDTAVEKQRSIKEADEQVVILKADIQKHTVDADELGRQIALLDQDTATWTGDQKAAAGVREVERADYDTLHKDYTESVDALQRAIAVLRKQTKSRPQQALTQVAKLKALKLVPPSAKRAIDLFFAQEPGLDIVAPEANGYDFRSSGIIDLLEKLLDKFVEERTQLEKEETNSRHAHELLQQDLSAQIEYAKQTRGEKAVERAKALQAKAGASGDLEDTTSTRADDDKYLSDLTGTCGQKSADFQQRQAMRAEEIKAIEQAIEILSGTVKGHADTYLPAMVQRRTGHSLAQLRAVGKSPQQSQAEAYIRAQAERIGSRVLSALAVHLADDPFSKVKTLIRDLIARLMEEATQEAEHKGWCDTELSTNAQTRKEKTVSVETLHAEIDELEASVSQLNEEITKLSKQVADLDRAMAEAVKIRQDEKAASVQTVKDAQEAQAAVAQAIVVLKEFYAKSGDATALMQRRLGSAKAAQEPPSIFDSPYTGMKGESGGVIGLLEVVQTDFARLEADTTASEATNQKTHDELMTNSKVDKAQKSKDIEHKSAQRQDQSQSITTKKSDLEGTQKELDAALEYYDKLKPSCVEAGESFDDRAARRKEEIESLQEALRILNGESIP